MKAQTIATGILCMLAWTAAQADTYPNKPIRFIVPFVAGGSGDVVGRVIGAKLTEAWGQQIVIDNRPGAAGTIGAGLVARSPADGYTLLLADDSSLAIAPHIMKSLPFDPTKDFAPIVSIAKIGFILSTNPSVPANNLQELVAVLKKNPTKYTYASAGIGSIHHLTMEWLKRRAGVEMVHVPYKGSGQILSDVAAGQVDITYTGFAQTMTFVQAGKLKPIAVVGAKSDALPNVKDISDDYPDFIGTVNWNLLAPAGTPDAIVQKMNTEVNRILHDPLVAKQLNSLGLTPQGGTAKELGEMVRTNHEKWGAVVKQIGLKPE